MAEEDILFGKRMHLFGGIEPSNLKSFTMSVIATEGNKRLARLTMTLPNDTVIDGQTLCTVAGVVIRKKSTGYPLDEFDGELVADVLRSDKTQKIQVDDKSMIDLNTAWYYAAFPYSTQGVYNRNPVNRITYNMPTDMKSFIAERQSDGVKLSFEWPDSAAGVLIRRSETGYPTDPEGGDDSTKIVDISASGSIRSQGYYVDKTVTKGKTYYYTAFSCSSNGTYNINIGVNSPNCAMLTIPTYVYLYGYDLDTTDSDPDTRVTYPADVMNTNYAAASMNFSSKTFNYGGWPSEAGSMFMPKPCMLNFDGTVAYYLDQDDYSVKADGTPAEITSASCGGNAMMEWPKIYTKRWEEDGIYHFRCSDVKVDADYECWCNYDGNNNEIDHFYTAIFTSSNLGNPPSSPIAYRSLSSRDPERVETFTYERSYSQKNGAGWDVEILADHLLIQDLLVMIAKTTNTQLAYGAGRSGSTSSDFKQTGATNAYGLFHGDEEGNVSVKVFGMEDYWGNLSRRILGLFDSYGTFYVKLTKGTKDGSTVDDYSIDNPSGYVKCNTVSGSGSTIAGYISKMTTYSWGRLPSEFAGSSATYESDYGDIALATTNGYPPAIIGGRYSDGLPQRGVFHYKFGSLDTATASYLTSRLSYKPTGS